jgi:large subunit ribosomal protein L21
MYAVIESGGKQYRVELGTELQVDRLDVRPGDTITLDRVLLIADGDSTAIGRPLVEGATVSASVVGQDRGEKIVVFKYKPKARRRVRQGHRAELTTLRIDDIALDGRSAASERQEEEAERTRAASRAEKAALERAAADQALAARLAQQAKEAEEAEQKAEDRTESRTEPKAAAKTRARTEPKVGSKAATQAAPATQTQPEPSVAAPTADEADAGDRPEPKPRTRRSRTLASPKDE